MRRLLVVVVAACGSPTSADVPGASLPPEPVLREPPAPHFALLTDRARTERATAIAQAFPASDHARVILDLAGFIDRIELARAVPKQAPADFLLATVRAHPREFGVIHPEALRAFSTERDVLVGEADRWTGSVHMWTSNDTVWIYGHLWPITTPVAPAVDTARLLAPYVGLQGHQPCKCIGRDSIGLTTTADMFDVRAGMALVCADGALHPRLAVAIRFQHNGAVPALAKLPTLFDARTLEPIDADYLLPTSNTAEVHDFSGPFSDDHHGCLRARLDRPPPG